MCPVNLKSGGVNTLSGLTLANAKPSAGYSLQVIGFLGVVIGTKSGVVTGTKSGVVTGTKSGVVTGIKSGVVTGIKDKRYITVKNNKLNRNFIFVSPISVQDIF
jgi:hypothetical protein